MTLLIFDCDGVLVDSERLANAALAELMTALGRPMTTEEAIGTFTGLSLADVMRRAEALLGHPVPESAGADAGRRLLTLFRRELKPVVGVKAAIAALPYRRCVASSSTPERIRLSLEVTGLAPMFDGHIYSAVQVERGKPAPDLFLFAARSAGEDPSGCVVVEDSRLGIAAARAAGMTAIGFTGASHGSAELPAQLAAAGAHAVVDTMRDLPATVEHVLVRRRTWP
jgi:HAD superfamily hydrolase (TIGR01509 family)